MKQSFTLVLICLFSQFLLAQENTEYCCGNKMDTVITLPHVVLPFGKYPQKVTVGVKNGNAFMEGDIDLGPLKDLIAKATEAESGVAIDAATYRWSNATIPYIINTDFSAAYQATILQAITYLDAQTNLCLVPRSQETDYVTFRTGTGCSSSVGRIGGQQFITLGNCSLGSVVHEICHAAGLYHEQSRENRNTFVTINLSNVQAGEEHNFNQAITGASDYGAYDYYAIMHYSRTAFAIDPSINTITPKLTLPTQNNVIAINPPLTGTINIGQRQGMTQGEVTTINTLYPTTCSTCNAPGTPSVSSIQATTATVTWPAVSGVSIYRVEIKRTVDAVWTNLGNGTTTSRNLTGLLAATGYQVRIYSVCSSTSTSNPSNIATFTTLAGPCNAPGTPSVSSIQATTATASWPAVSGVSIYRVEIKRTVDAVWTNLGNGTTTSRNLTGLLAATGYQVRIYSVCSSTSTSNPSNIATFTTLAGPCNAPGTPSVSSIQATTATASWPAVSGVSIYRVEIKRTVDAVWTNLGNGTTTSRNLTGLLAATGYQVRIYSVCSSTSTSSPSNIATFTTLAGPCNAPGTPSVSSIQATTATVSWPAVSGVSTYRVELKRTVDAAWSNLGNTALTSTGLTNLVANTSYQVRIYSVCSSSSTSNPSNIATFTTLAGSYDNPCGALTFTPITACNQTVMTNINASATATPPPPGGCGIDNIRDVWFRCQSPATGKVNITTFPGTMTDGVIGLYFGNDCGNLSYYNCWDDTNGDEMPDIWASISPGNWIYLRYWGYEGAVGSFSVCVQIAPASNIDNTPRAGITEKPLALEASSRTPQSTSMETSNTQSGNRAMLRVAPNPAHEYLTFHTDKLENIHHVQVLGADGREMLSQNFSLVSSDFSLDVRALPTGMYVLKASLESGGIAIGRFVKE